MNETDERILEGLLGVENGPNQGPELYLFEQSKITYLYKALKDLHGKRIRITVEVIPLGDVTHKYRDAYACEMQEETFGACGPCEICGRSEEAHRTMT